MGMKYLKHLAAVSLMTSLLLGCGGGSSSGVESGTGASDSNYDPFDAIFSGYKGYREIDGPTQFYRLEGITPICVNPDRVTRQGSGWFACYWCDPDVIEGYETPVELRFGIFYNAISYSPDVYDLNNPFWMVNSLYPSVQKCLSGLEHQ